MKNLTLKNYPLIEWKGQIIGSWYHPLDLLKWLIR